MRTVDTGGTPGDPPAGQADETWELAAVGPSWRPVAGEPVVAPVAGALEIHSDALVFRARDAVDAATRAPLVAVIPATSIRTIGPLSPGSPGAGGWLPRWQRRLRCPGFVVATETGAWVFDGPHGQRHAGALRDRFGFA